MTSGSRRFGGDGPVLVAPLMLFLLALLGFPLAVDLVYSVSKVDFETIRSPTIIGFANYAKALSDPEFWSAAWFSLRFGVIVATLQVGIGLILALVLAPLLSRHSWLMAPLMLPMMVAPALVGLMYRLLLHEFVGPVPFYTEMVFGDFPAYLGKDHAFTTLVIIETLQWTPFALLILFTAYSSIQPEIREAAAIDGASAWRRLVEIDLPLMSPVIGVTAFIRFIDSFRVFDNIYTLVGAGAGGSTTSMSIYIYQAFFKTGDIGLAVAASMVLLAGSSLVLLAISRLTALRGRS